MNAVILLILALCSCSSGVVSREPDVILKTQRGGSDSVLETYGYDSFFVRRGVVVLQDSSIVVVSE